MTQRKIAFRAWDGKKMQSSDEFADFRDINEVSRLSKFFASMQFHKEWPVMQFTGLLDKNRKEIYEGDVIKAFDKKYEEVFWHQPDACFRFSSLPIDYNDEVEVIGNIYENPELLKP